MRRAGTSLVRGLARAGQRARTTSTAAPRAVPDDGLTLADFLQHRSPPDAAHPSGESHEAAPGSRSVFIETYGCQMNSADSEIVSSVLSAAGYSVATDATLADVVLLNTCAIRENAEAKASVQRRRPPWDRHASARAMPGAR